MSPRIVEDRLGPRCPIILLLQRPITPRIFEGKLPSNEIDTPIMKGNQLQYRKDSGGSPPSTDVYYLLRMHIVRNFRRLADWSTCSKKCRQDDALHTRRGNTAVKKKHKHSRRLVAQNGQI
jgi:hypothetical protein